MPLFYYTLSFWLGIKYQKYQSWSWWLPIYWELCYEQLDSSIHELNWRDIDKTIAAGNISISYVSEWKSLSRVRLFETLWTVALCTWDSVHGILQRGMLEWVAMPSSRGSYHPRDWTQVSYIAGDFFTNWATREAHHIWFWI